MDARRRPPQAGRSQDGGGQALRRRVDFAKLRRDEFFSQAHRAKLLGNLFLLGSFIYGKSYRGETAKNASKP